MKKIIGTVVIDRSKWLRFPVMLEKNLYSMLLDSKGNRCCLGFLCKAAGVKDDVIKKIPSPSAAFSRTNIPKSIQWLLKYCAGVTTNSDDCDMAMNFNDSPKTYLSEFSHEGQEEAIRQLFNKHGWEVKFIN